MCINSTTLDSEVWWGLAVYWLILDSIWRILQSLLQCLQILILSLQTMIVSLQTMIVSLQAVLVSLQTVVVSLQTMVVYIDSDLGSCGEIDLNVSVSINLLWLQPSLQTTCSWNQSRRSEPLAVSPASTSWTVSVNTPYGTRASQSACDCVSPAPTCLTGGWTGNTTRTCSSGPPSKSHVDLWWQPNIGCWFVSFILISWVSYFHRY